MTIEHWKPVAGFEGLYEVSDQGRVRSLPRVEVVTRLRFGKVDTHQRCRPGGFVALGTASGGYVKVCLWKDGKPCYAQVQRLVLEAFVALQPSRGHVARHLDGNPKNNRPENLAWGTPKENVADSIRHGTWVRGEKSGNAKLTESKVKQTRCASGTQRELARQFGVSQTTIWQVKRRGFWKHVEA